MNIAIKVPINIESFIGQLSSRDKIELARRLERETRRERWGGLLSRIRKRMAGKSISDKEIMNCVKETRKALHA